MPLSAGDCHILWYKDNQLWSRGLDLIAVSTIYKLFDFVQVNSLYLSFSYLQDWENSNMCLPSYEGGLNALVFMYFLRHGTRSELASSFL